jgi:hypothetical protein
MAKPPFPFLASNATRVLPAALDLRQDHQQGAHRQA